MLKRTPFRLAATFTVLFATTVIGLFAILYFGISASLDEQNRRRVQETMDALLVIDRQREYDELTTVVSGESDSVRDTDFIFELVDETGKFVAGNVQGLRPSDGWQMLRRSDLPLDTERGEPDDQFAAVWHPVSKGHLLVGSSNREVRQTQAFLLEVLGFGLVATTLIGAACGAYLARQTQHRIDAFANTLSAVSQGQISARVPMHGSGDDIDHVGAQINRTLHHLQKLIENVNQASSDIAHDLKKPVGRLRQRLDIARLTATTGAEFRSEVEGALADLDSMIETFDALLRITQIEAGARRARFADLDLRSVLEDVADIYVAVAEDAGLDLNWSSGGVPKACVRGDRELLVQLFANLIENCIRHCPKGTEITLVLESGVDAFRAEVLDNGPGIPEGEREKVFRRLYRLEHARSTPGSGLGLTLAQAIAELHDAKIVLGDNAPGLRVSISFPKTPWSDFTKA